MVCEFESHLAANFTWEEAVNSKKVYKVNI